jgi:hypothetical protein
VELAEADFRCSSRNSSYSISSTQASPRDKARKLLERVRDVAKALAEERPPSDQSDGQEGQT